MCGKSLPLISTVLARTFAESAFVAFPNASAVGGSEESGESAFMIGHNHSIRLAVTSSIRHSAGSQVLENPAHGSAAWRTDCAVTFIAALFQQNG